MMRIIATVALLSAAFSACCLGGEKASFTVATCNIQMAPTPSANKWEFRKDFQKELLEKYRFDIFGMQETFKHQIDYVLPDGYAYIGCGRDDGAQKGEYSPIAYDKSKFNCMESGVFWLSQTPSRPSFGWDAACRRLCTWGRFRHLKSGKIFYFFNTHLDHKGKVARAEGVKLILKRVGEIAKGGSFIITGVVPGTYTLLASKSGYNSKESIEFSVEPSSDKTIDSMALEIGVRSITGSVELELTDDYSGVLVTATNLEDSSNITSAITNSAGTFSLAGLVPGEYLISISKPGYRTMTLETVNVIESQPIT